MKFFKISTRDVEAVDLNEEENVSLGEDGRGRKRVLVPVIGQGPEARVKKTNDGYVIILGDFPPDEKCLCIVNTWGGYSKGRSYSLPGSDGITPIVSGYVASGMAGRAAGGEHALCIIRQGTSFKLRSKYDATWFTWDGQDWIVETPAEHSCRMALEAIERGEGEWL